MKYILGLIIKITYVKIHIKDLFPFIHTWSHFPALVGWCAMSSGIYTFFQWINPPHASSLLYRILTLISILFLIMFTLFFGSRILRFICLFSLGLFISMQTISDQHLTLDNCGNSFPSGVKYRLRGDVQSIPLSNKGKFVFIIRVVSFGHDRCPTKFFHKNILCYARKEPPAYGSVEMIGKFQPPRMKEHTRGGFDECLYYMSNNLWGVFYGDSIIKEESNDFFLTQWATSVRSLTKRALGRIKNEEYRGILTASFLNEKADLSENMKTLFFNAGIYHLLALSGFNIAVLAGMMYAILLLFPIKKEIKIILVLVMVWLYLLFIGFIPSLFRAVIMTTVVGVSFIFQKKNYPLNALGIAGIFWLVTSPQSLFTPSYQLSFAATFGLITLSPIFNDLFKLIPLNSLQRKVFKPFWVLASVSFASFIATAPILIYHFNQLYLFGLFSNLFAISLMAIAMWLACVGFIFELFFPPLAALCMYLAQGFIHVMIQGAGLVNFVPWSIIRISLPYPEIYFVFSLGFIGFILIKKERRFLYSVITFSAAAALSLLLIYFHMESKEVQVAFINDKKTALVAIKWPNNRAWVINVGGEMPSFSAYQRYVSPWKSQFTGCKINRIILPRWSRDAVHFLGPILENEKNADITYLDSGYVHDEDFITFVHSFNRALNYKKTGDVISVGSACTCKVISRLDKSDDGKLAFILRVYNSVVFVPDLPGKILTNVFYRNQIISINRDTWKIID
jgi:ComEC/Rec2-related protein